MPTTFLFHATACADTGNERFRPGERHEALMFVVGDDVDAARDRAVAEMLLAHWRDIEVRSSSIAREDHVEAPDPGIRAARQSARDHGIGIVFWTPPLDAGALPNEEL